MFSHLRSRLTYANIVSSLALFLVLTGGTAVALTGKNTVFSDDITNNEVRTADVRDDNLRGGGLASRDVRPNALTGADVSALTGGDVNDNSLTGSDINEASLGQVPSAQNAGNAGTLDALDSTAFARSSDAHPVRVVTVNAPATTGEQTATLVTDGALKVVGHCQTTTVADRNAAIAVHATTGAVSVSVDGGPVNPSSGTFFAGTGAGSFNAGDGGSVVAYNDSGDAIEGLGTAERHFGGTDDCRFTFGGTSSP